jgi:hypothetical protein
MRFLPRLRYILEVCHPASPVVFNILDVLVRIARHSIEAAHSVAKCPRLLDTILVQFLPSSWKAKERSVTVTDVYGYPLVKALKLFRVLCCAGKYLADTLVGLSFRMSDRDVILDSVRSVILTVTLLSFRLQSLL